jgi:GNAT superfamily N-acetyltransferase
MKYPLLTPRLSIEPLSIADLASFISYRQDPEIARYQGWDSSYSREKAIELITSQQGVFLPKLDDWLQLGIRSRDNGELLGDLALHAVEVDVDVEDDAAKTVFEIGFTVAAQHQGKGFAREAAAALMNTLTAEFGAKKFIASSDRRNIPSIKVLLALGFKPDESKTWTEEFKNELVTMHHFETQ